MLDEILALAEARAKKAVGRVAVSTAFALVAGLFFLIAVAGLFAAFFFWLERDHGPIVAALICAGVAVGLGIVALLPLVFRPRPPPPQDSPLPQFVSLMAKTAPGLRPRQIIVAAALVGAAVLFGARGKKK